MKNLKKLVIASFMLVIAFVAVVSSTYAWFTTSKDATVNNITIGVVDADAALLISKDGKVGSWRGDISFLSATENDANDFFGKFTPVTITGDASAPAFKKLNSSYELVNTDVEDLNGQAYSASVTPEGYLSFDIYFQVTIGKGESFADYKLVMDILNLNATNPKDSSVNNHAIGSFRLAVAKYNAAGTAATIDAASGVDTNKILEGVGANLTGRYGSGDQFLATNAWMALYDEEDLVKPVDGSDPAKYELETALVNELEGYTTQISDGHEYTINCNSLESACYDQATLYEANELVKYFKVRIYVWMEGWDGDNINAAAGCDYTFGLKFAVEHVA